MTHDQTERLIAAFERMASGQEKAVAVSEQALGLQLQMAKSSAALEKALSKM